MKKWLKRLGVLLLLLFAAAAIFIVPTVWFKPWSINHFYMRVLVEALIEDPLALTQLKLLESVGIHYKTDELPDMSITQLEKMREFAKRNREMLASYDTKGMDEEALLSHQMMSWLLARWTEASDRFLYHSYALDQLNGLHVRFPDAMINYHDIHSERDAKDYTARVEKIAFALGQLVETTETLEKKGFTIPNFLLQKCAKDASDFAAKPFEENSLRVDFQKKVAALEELEEEKKKSLRETFDQALKTKAIPGYEKFAASINAMATRTSSAAGVWHLPDGDAWYKNRIEDSTTTTMSADEIHALGLAEVARIQAEMNAIMDAQGVERTSFREGLDKLAADPRYQWPDTDAGREAIVAEYTRIIEEISGKLEPMFKTDPKKKVAVERVPTFKEKTSPGAYYFPEALDGSKPGTFFVNLRDVKAHVKYGMRTLAYHEAVPGHHFQISIAMSQKDLPLVRRLIPLTAYSEGWALYAEQLAAENGFQEAPLDRLGYLNAQLFRAVRLVLDTGIHAKRWSRQQAIDYAMANMGMEQGEIEAEVDRYCVWPGQALGYMVGRLKLLELRERARAKTGARFDLREFHDLLLLSGALPLAMVDERVDRWISQRNGFR